MVVVLVLLDLGVPMSPSTLSGDTLWKVIAGAVTIGSLLVGVVRYIDGLEARMQRIELREQYIHGTFTVPGAK